MAESKHALGQGRENQAHSCYEEYRRETATPLFQVSERTSPRPHCVSGDKDLGGQQGDSAVRETDLGLDHYSLAE